MFQGQPDFPAILNALENALNGNFTALLYSSAPTVESVVALPLECGDVGMVSYHIPCQSYPQAKGAIKNTTT
jgi:hypothetical protein